MDKTKEIIGEWYLPKWFYPANLTEYDWENPFWLYAIPAILLLFLARFLLTASGSKKLGIALFPKEVINDFSSYLRFIPPVFLALSLAMFFVSLARPQKSNEKVEQWTEGIDIMVTMDISESMKIEDFKPNRLEAAKRVAMDFIDGRFQDRIGLVVFSGEAYSRCPLTTDYDLLRSYIKDIDFKLIQKTGTAIGSAIGVSINRMRDSESKSKVMILLSDGDNNAGNIDPVTAAKLAQAYEIKIYTIAIGKEGRVPYGTDVFGRTRYIDNSLDETTLREIAKIGNGNFYRVDNNEALSEVFAEIDQLEKAEIKESRYKDVTDFYYPYLMWGIVLLLFWLLMKSTFMTSALRD